MRRPAPRPGRLAPALLLGAAAASLACSPGRPDRPHVVLLSIDTLRADHVGLYGGARQTTPRIDRFFAQGSTFEHAVSSSPCTVPSVRQFLTGRLLRDLGAASLAERLGRAGYRTAAVVSQHHFTEPGAWPYARGFDDFDVQGPDEVDQHGMTRRTAEAVTERALRWLERQDGRRPLFLWLHYFDPHDPYEPPQAYRRFDDGNESERSGDRRRYLQEERASPETPWQLAGAIFSEPDVAHFRNLYDGEILFTDAEIGRVLDALEQRGWVGNSVVALLSDHGERLGEGGVWDHCLGLSEAELRVPFLIRARGAALGGRARWSGPVSTLDLLPTLLALAGVELDETEMAGRNLLAAPEPRTVVAQWGHGRAIYSDRWKLVVRGGSRLLFDLHADPGETRNLAPGRPALVGRLLAEAARAGEDPNRIAAETRAELEQLRALGYLE